MSNPLQHPLVQWASDHWRRVMSMMRLFNQETPGRPAIPDEATRRLRCRLVLEEAFELVEAYGFHLTVSIGHGQLVNLTRLADDGAVEPPSGEVVLFALQPGEREPLSLTSIVDAHVDISVVNQGGLVACGVPDKPVLESVDVNNWEKVGGGKTDEQTGKFIKSPDHKPPNIRCILEHLGADPAEL